MQAESPGAVDGPARARPRDPLYGLDQKATAEWGRQCLLARCLVERGVRFVQLYHGAGSKWDAHSKLEQNHSSLCQAMDQPVAGLLRDLHPRGLLDETLVVRGGEFGRTPMSEKGDGRDHNPTGFTMWMAGGGIRGGQVLGRDRRTRLARGGRQDARSRLARHDLALDGPGPHGPGLQIQRPPQRPRSTKARANVKLMG